MSFLKYVWGLMDFTWWTEDFPTYSEADEMDLYPPCDEEEST